MRTILIAALAMGCGLGSTVLATDLNVTVQVAGCDSSTVTVGPMCPTTYRVIGELSDAGSDGLALVVFDLEFDGGALAQADEPTELPMANFVPPAGFCNPDGYGGTVIGGRLVQVGGAQNVLVHGQWDCESDDECPAPSTCVESVCTAISGLPLGSLIGNVAQPGSPVVLVSGSLIAPATPGSYAFDVTNLVANVVEKGAFGLPFWMNEAAGVGTVTNLSITVEPGASCCEISEACCLADGYACVMAGPVACVDELGGIPQGMGTACDQPEACCLPDGTCEMIDPLCCDDAGGTAQGAGTACGELEACCFPDGSCAMVDPLCCVDAGGAPQGAGTTCGGVEACCLPGGVCLTADAWCCVVEFGSVPQGVDTVCTTPEACCLPDGTCRMLDPMCCDEAGGSSQGPGTICGGMEACCLSDGTCVMADALCCMNVLDGMPQGAGTLCTAPEACCLPGGTCEMLDPLCCDCLGGTAQGAGTVCTTPVACCWGIGNTTCSLVDPLCCESLGGTSYPGEQCGEVQGCCVPGPDTCLAGCVTANVLCCVEGYGGTPMGPNTSCEGDADELLDSDGDGVADLCDICKGADDAIFCPGCKTAIPTVSTWGLVILALFLLTVAKVFFHRRSTRPA